MRALNRSSGLDKHADHSGTITTGGVSQQVLAQDQDRMYLFLQNNGSGDMWVNFSIAAVIGQPSIRVPAGSELVEEGNFVSGEAVFAIAADSAHPFTCKTSQAIGAGTQAGAP
jgi:hypothetical protein